MCVYGWVGMAGGHKKKASSWAVKRNVSRINRFKKAEKTEKKNNNKKQEIQSFF